MITRVGLYHEPKRARPWLVCWRGDPDPDTGKQRKHSKSFRYKRDALEFQANKQADLNTGGSRSDLGQMTLGQLLSDYRDARVASLAYSSQRLYSNMIVQLNEYFGNARLVHTIQQQHAERFMATRARRDGREGELSRATLAQILTYARAIFDAAIDWGYIARNPFRVRRGRSNSVLRIKAKPRPWQHIEPSEFLHFLTFVPNVKHRAAYWLMYGCGLRPGEAYSLTADKVDLESRQVHVENRAATAEHPPFKVKADDVSGDSKERTVPIPEAAVPDLNSAVREAFRSGGFVMLSPSRYAYVRDAWAKCRRGERWGANLRHRPWSNSDMVNNFLRAAKRALRRARVELTAPFTLKTFRKSCAQNLADQGVPPKTLAKLLGHSSVQVTMEYYNRVTDANEKAAAAALDKLFSGQGKRGRNAG